MNFKILNYMGQLAPTFVDWGVLETEKAPFMTLVIEK